MNTKPKVHLVCDLADSFMHDYLPSFCRELQAEGTDATFVTEMIDLISGDISFFLSCKTILSSAQLALHQYNVVIHPSKLPEGRGSGAVSWKILEGSTEIWISLFQPTEKLDRGPIYYQECFTLTGSELCDEIRALQAQLSFKLIRRFLCDYPNIPLKAQAGEGNYYRKRTPKDSELTVDKTIREQFNLLRISDNLRYPAFFTLNGYEYVLRIEKRKRQ